MGFLAAFTIKFVVSVNKSKISKGKKLSKWLLMLPIVCCASKFSPGREEKFHQRGHYDYQILLQGCRVNTD